MSRELKLKAVTSDIYILNLLADMSQHVPDLFVCVSDVNEWAKLFEEHYPDWEKQNAKAGVVFLSDGGEILFTTIRGNYFDGTDGLVVEIN